MNVSSNDLLSGNAPASEEEAASRADQLARYPDGRCPYEVVNDIHNGIEVEPKDAEKAASFFAVELEKQHCTTAAVKVRVLNFALELQIDGTPDSDSKGGACPDKRKAQPLNQN